MGPWRWRATPAGRLAGLLSAGVVLAACAQPTAQHPTPKAAATAQPRCQATPGHRGDNSPGMGPIAAGRVALGPGMALTPSPNLVASTRGEPLEISGVVYDQRCRPLAGSRIELWQANANGAYGPPQGTGEIRCCYLQGAVETDAGGRYVVDTIKPGSYMGPPTVPGHIHFWVSHPGEQSLSIELNFGNNPSVPADAGPVVPLRASGSGLQATFDIVL